MAKFCGVIGFVETKETSPGVWSENEYYERQYTGDVLRSIKRYENGENLNDNIQINNQFSIVADRYAYEHFFAMRYIRWMGTDWKITSIEDHRPRLILTIGGLWNG